MFTLIVPAGGMKQNCSSKQNSSVLVAAAAAVVVGAGGAATKMLGDICTNAQTAGGAGADAGGGALDRTVPPSR